MYLAQKRIQGKIQFFIRESFRDGDLVRSRELFCLGNDPSRFIIYPGGNAFYIDEAVTDALYDLHVDPSSNQLDDVFWPFLKPSVQRVLEPFRSRSVTGTCHKRNASLPCVHPFDQRRASFLKCGRTSARLPQSLLRQFEEKSRDEIEQQFTVQECCLRESEIKTYAYFVFDLQRFFSESFAREHPQWLDQERIEKHFLEEICRLHEDGSFWAGEREKNGSEQTLHAYLRRYVILFFDNDFERRHPMDEYVRDFMNRHRFRHGVRMSVSVSVEKASVIFGVKKETLRTMTKRGLTRYYRRLAKKLHPDKGGSHERFVELTEAYRAMLRKRNQL